MYIEQDISSYTIEMGELLKRKADRQTEKERE